MTLAADVYGSRVTYHGHIAGLAAGTGAAFALLPAQNASGNWIKVVQRVPVRIALDPRELAAHPLRIGLSMQVEVDLRDSTDSDAPLAQAAPASPVAATDVYSELGKAARARIQAIIGANSGGPAAPPLAEPVSPGTAPAAAAQATAPRRTQA